jgi:hypothetical protein
VKSVFTGGDGKSREMTTTTGSQGKSMPEVMPGAGYGY